jgi:cyclase
VKGERFNSWRSVGHVLQAAKVHAARHVDELLILDIGATPEGRSPDFAAIKELTRECFCPLTVGGGVRTIDDARKLLAAGADKIAIGAASKDSSIVRKLSATFGKQAIVVIVDYDSCGNAAARSRVISQCIEQQYWGAGEVLLQAIDRDGTMQGYDLRLIGSVSSILSIPVIACGGCSGYEDMENAIRVGASAVAVGALFQFTEATPRGAVEYLAQRGIETRIPA